MGPATGWALIEGGPTEPKSMSPNTYYRALIITCTSLAVP